MFNIKSNKAMKKTYQNPKLKVVRIQTAKMIAASTTLYGKDANSAAMGRQGGFIDDEEE